MSIETLASDLVSKQKKSWYLIKGIGVALIDNATKTAESFLGAELLKFKSNGSLFSIEGSEQDTIQKLPADIVHPLPNFGEIFSYLTGTNKRNILSEDDVSKVKPFNLSPLDMMLYAAYIAKQKNQHTIERNLSDKERTILKNAFDIFIASQIQSMDPKEITSSKILDSLETYTKGFTRFLINPFEYSFVPISTNEVIGENDIVDEAEVAVVPQENKGAPMEKSMVSFKIQKKYKDTPRQMATDEEYLALDSYLYKKNEAVRDLFLEATSYLTALEAAVLAVYLNHYDKPNFGVTQMFNRGPLGADRQEVFKAARDLLFSAFDKIIWNEKIGTKHKSFDLIVSLVEKLKIYEKKLPQKNALAFLYAGKINQYFESSVIELAEQAIDEEATEVIETQAEKDIMMSNDKSQNEVQVFKYKAFLEKYRQPNSKPLGKKDYQTLSNLLPSDDQVVRDFFALGNSELTAYEAITLVRYLINEYGGTNTHFSGLMVNIARTFDKDSKDVRQFLSSAVGKIVSNNDLLNHPTYSYFTANMLENLKHLNKKFPITLSLANAFSATEKHKETQSEIVATETVKPFVAENHSPAIASVKIDVNDRQSIYDAILSILPEHNVLYRQANDVAFKFIDDLKEYSNLVVTLIPSNMKGHNTIAQLMNHLGLDADRHTKLKTGKQAEHRKFVLDALDEILIRCENIGFEKFDSNLIKMFSNKKQKFIDLLGDNPDKPKPSVPEAIKAVADQAPKELAPKKILTATPKPVSPPLKESPKVTTNVPLASAFKDNSRKIYVVAELSMIDPDSKREVLARAASNILGEMPFRIFSALALRDDGKKLSLDALEKELDLPVDVLKGRYNKAAEGLDIELRKSAHTSYLADMPAIKNKYDI